MFFTVPVSAIPSVSTASVCFFFSSRSVSSTARRDSTTLPRRRLSLMTLARMVCPSMVARFFTGRRRTWEPGGNARHHRRAGVEGLGDLVPHLDLVGLVLGEDDEPLRVFLGLEEDFDLVSHLGRAAVAELLHGDGALALVADVHDHVARPYLDDATADHLPFLDVPHPAGQPVLRRLFGISLPRALRAREARPLTFIRRHKS